MFLILKTDHFLVLCGDLLLTIWFMASVSTVDSYRCCCDKVDETGKCVKCTSLFGRCQEKKMLFDGAKILLQDTGFQLVIVNVEHSYDS